MARPRKTTSNKEAAADKAVAPSPQKPPSPTPDATSPVVVTRRLGMVVVRN